ncbi:uncharacterized protein MEPE_00472 [Melanopsichium pennsylvanicum]|uniref:Uncharacterized protein n=2 Tax=Melanopsichium pennsylvanicum TaxID=63383 RepID=A0AAJ5C2Q9_9BASI|nr:conserved hypothetical protein [Melanopsichium pennsylvanicum 4]SNX81767.1 uncharacterized protein MEPE_00472 [Melanopsichium pennsylvanicum]
MPEYDISTNQQSHAPKSGFHQAASFVERALSFRTNSQRATSSSLASEQDVPSSAQQRCLARPTIHVPLTKEDLKETRIFPHLPDSQIENLLPGEELEQARQWIKAAIQDMHLNYDLDPKLLGERSDTNKGNSLIALLLSRIFIPSSGSGDEHERGEGHLSGLVPGGEAQSTTNALSTSQAFRSKSAGQAPSREYETHDLLKAIDKKDLETILAIRNANFDLLLDLNQGGTTSKTSPAASQAGGSTNTPLGYAISLGKGWENVSIVLVGALSKFVNQLPDDEDEYESHPQNPNAIGGSVTKVKKSRKLQLDPRTMVRLRKIRVNLKLAIDHSIFQDQTSLLASYLQVLVMSEGSPFLHAAVEDVEHCISSRRSASGQADVGADAVERARSQVMQFVTESLRHKSDKVAAVKDYIANAQGDLLLMALWDLIKLTRSQLDAVKDNLASSGDEAELGELGNPLPIYFFARDDRVAAHFIARIGKLEHAVEGLKGAKGPPSGFVRLAGRVAEALQQGARRKTSFERLELITGVLNGKSANVHG